MDQIFQGARVQDAVQRACVKGDAASGAPVTLGAGAQGPSSGVAPKSWAV